MKVCVVYEPWAHGESHVEFNKAFLSVLCSLYDSVAFYGEKAHVRILRDNLISSKITFTVLKITDYEHIAGKMAAFVIELWNILRIRKRAKGNDVFFTYGAAHTMLYAEKILQKNRCFYVQHGALETIYKKLSPLKLHYWLPSAMQKCPDNHAILVLGESIKNNLLKQMPFLAGKVFSVNHPYVSSQLDLVIPQIEEKEAIFIGTIGVGSVEKGLQELNELARYLKSKESTRIHLQHVGRILDCNLNKSLVDVPFDNACLVPRADYVAAVKKLDFILFLYPIDSYKLTASGAIFDAFQYGKPVIALQNDFFADVFRKFNKIGYICENIEQMKSVFDTLENIHQHDYDEMCKASNRALGSFSPAVVADQLRYILSNKNLRGI